MILRRLHNEYGLNIEGVLIKEYKRLGLKMKELNVLLILLSTSSKKRIFSINSITKKSDYNHNEVAEIVNVLLEKEFITLSLIEDKGKTKEVYSLDKTFEKLTNLFIEDEKADIVANNKTHISETIDLLEQRLNRPLRDLELDRIRLWYEDYQFIHQNIINAIKAFKNNFSILYLEKILDSNYQPTKKIDTETEKILDNIYKKL